MQVCCGHWNVVALSIQILVLMQVASRLVRIFFGTYLYSRRGLTVRVKVPALWKCVLKCLTLSMILIGKRKENHSGFLHSTSFIQHPCPGPSLNIDH